ncbi:hypothetical protein CEV34_4927 [Brucella pseudogrignonensis]|uniref:Uncharacterized protein n=1 Tax=Brucella pseudogrignonensis TaxID=419475 RepID=A0A256G3I1_9HYPH|nr:hypothetical protein CEV34_4927 [Brucella pseudogrignonensis]
MLPAARQRARADEGRAPTTPHARSSGRARPFATLGGAVRARP